MGNQRPIKLLAFIELIEKHLGVTAIRKFVPMQTGDVLKTVADTSPVERYVGYAPHVSIEDGVAQTVAWYLGYRGTNPQI